MRSTTKWAAGCLGTWFFLNLTTCAVAPTGLNDPDFGAKVTIGSNIQGLAGMFLVASIILILVTAYNNLFTKETVSVNGDWNQASYGSSIVSRSSGSVSVNATYDASLHNYSILSDRQTISLRDIRSFLEQSSAPEASKGVRIINDIEKEIQKGGLANTELVLGWISRALSIAEKISPAATSIKDAITNLKELV